MTADMRQRDFDIAALKTRLDNTNAKYGVIKDTFVRVEQDNRKLTEQLSDANRRLAAMNSDESSKSNLPKVWQ